MSQTSERVQEQVRALERLIHISLKLTHAPPARDVAGRRCLGPLARGHIAVTSLVAYDACEQWGW